MTNLVNFIEVGKNDGQIKRWLREPQPPIREHQPPFKYAFISEEDK